jgi:hypothetical protein
MKHLGTSIGLALFSAPFAWTAPVMAQEGPQMGVVVLNSADKSAFRLSGTAQVMVPVIRVNSSHAEGLSASGTIILDSPDVATVGGAVFGGGASCTSTVHIGEPSTSDPLSWLPTPIFNPSNDLGGVSFSSGGNYSVQPGYYSGGITISGGTLTMTPGIYILDGVGLKVSGSSTSIVANGVMLYFQGTGKLYVSGGALDLTPPTTGTYAGVSIFQARDSNLKSTLSGGTGIDVSGAVYLPAGKIVINGNGDAQEMSHAPSVGGIVIANMVEVGGNGIILIGMQPQIPTPELQYD